MSCLHETTKEVLGKRRDPRAYVRIRADARASGGLRSKVSVVDLSRTGFQMECLTYFPADRPVFLTLPGFMQLEASIAWHDDWHYGCSFSSPLHPAVYDHIVNTYPAFGQSTSR